MPVLATIGTDSLRPYGFAAGTPRDPFFSSTRLLLAGIGTNGANNSTFTDGTGVNTVTRAGNVTQGSASPFTLLPNIPYNAVISAGSAGFDGTGDYLSVPDSAALEPGAGNFCIEFWFYATFVTGTATLITKRTASSAFGPYLIQRVGTSIQISLSSNGTSWDIANAQQLTGVIATNLWNRVVLYRSGNDFYASLNGNTSGIVVSSSATLIGNASAIYIGGDTNTNYFYGNIGSLRIVNGSSVYTGSTSPIPTAPFTNISDTKLLLNFTGGNVYDSTQYNNFQTFAGANISTALAKWGTSSINFAQNNTGYIQSLDTQNVALGAGNFTIDFWLYVPTRLLSYILDINGLSNTSDRLVIRSESNGTFTLRGSSLTQLVQTSATYPYPAAAWAHIAVMRVSGDIGVYVNGVRAVAAYANTTTFNGVYNGGFAVGGLYNAGGTGGVGGFNVQDYRITPGIARFTSSTTLGAQAFTPPTGPAPLIGP